MMDLQERQKLVAALLRLAAATGTTLGKDRTAIYVEDLSSFPLERVLEVLEWSRKNLEAFPMIPQLLRQLEGNSELRKRFVRNYRHNYERRHALTEGHTFKGSDQIDLEQGRIFQVSRVACYRVWGQSVVLDRVERVEKPKPGPPAAGDESPARPLPEGHRQDHAGLDAGRAAARHPRRHPRGSSWIITVRAGRVIRR
jgi:hypothetical protein